SAVTRAAFVSEASTHLRLAPLAAEKDFQAFTARQLRQAAARPTPAAAEEPHPADYEAHPGEEPGGMPTAQGAAKPKASTGLTPERDILLMLLHFETLGKPLSHTIPHDWVDSGHVAGSLLNRFLGEFEQDAWPGKDHLDGLLENEEERALVASLGFETLNVEDPVKVVQKGLEQLRARAFEPRLRQIELALANPHADSESDPISLLKERSDLQRQLRTPLVLAAVV
ncbi:MAG TPA: DNA primase, partial [Opitutaceae bacterium]